MKAISWPEEKNVGFDYELEQEAYQKDKRKKILFVLRLILFAVIVATLTFISLK